MPTQTELEMAAGAAVLARYSAAGSAPPAAAEVPTKRRGGRPKKAAVTPEVTDEVTDEVPDEGTDEGTDGGTDEPHLDFGTLGADRL